jgi:hypothetical protein
MSPLPAYARAAIGGGIAASVGIAYICDEAVGGHPEIVQQAGEMHDCRRAKAPFGATDCIGLSLGLVENRAGKGQKGLRGQEPRIIGRAASQRRGVIAVGLHAPS